MRITVDIPPADAVRRAEPETVDVVCDEFASGVSMRMRWIPAGRFTMGSPEGELWRWRKEEEQHEVTLTRGFWLGETQVTQEQWRAVMGTNPSRFKGDTLPVEQVSWDDCQEFCRRLNERMPELGARLPTEAEWEYACRAGTTSAFNDGSECTKPEGWDPALVKLGWYIKNSGRSTYPARSTHPVCQCLPNAWGLYDMHGNVWEWCDDGLREYDGPATDPRGPEEFRRAARGGSWRERAGDCRSSSRAGWSAAARLVEVGLRIAAGGNATPSCFVDRHVSISAAHRVVTECAVEATRQ